MILSFPAINYAQNEQDISTEEIKVISIYGSDILSSPSKMTVLDKSALSRRNGSNLSDVLKTVSGVFVKSYGSSSSLQTISMNGLGAEHTVILLNGSKLNSLQNGLFDLSLVPLLSIKKIEVLNNGYSSLFGSESVGGVINIITGNAKNEMLKAELRTAYGSNNSHDLSLSVSGSRKKFNWDISASNEKSDNDFSYYFDNGIEKELKNRLGAGYNISNYSFSSQYIFNPALHVNYYTQFTDSKKDLPGIETGIAAPSGSQYDRNWNNILQLNYSRRNFSIISDLNFQNNLDNYHTGNVINSYYKNILVAGSGRVEMYKGSNTYTFGTEMKYGTLYSNELVSDIDRKHYALYNSNIIRVSKLVLIPSFRYDHISDLNRSALTYRLGASYKPFEKLDLHLRGNAGRNFRVPSFNDLYWKEGGNTDLKPEYSQNYEAGLVIHKKFAADITFDISYLNILMEDRIVWIPHRNSFWSPVNIGRSRSRIFNAGIKILYPVFKDISAKLELSYSENSSVKTNEDLPQDPTTGMQVIYIPLNQVQSNLELKTGKAGFNLFYSYLGKRFSDQENLYMMSPVNILDGNIYADIPFSKFKAQIKLEINNITNSDYQIISGYPVPLRNFKIKLNLDYTL
ncbi:TonB-dependent receptor [soil metagenome]